MYLVFHWWTLISTNRISLIDDRHVFWCTHLCLAFAPYGPDLQGKSLSPGLLQLLIELKLLSGRRLNSFHSADSSLLHFLFSAPKLCNSTKSWFLHLLEDETTTVVASHIVYFCFTIFMPWSSREFLMFDHLRWKVGSIQLSEGWSFRCRLESLRSIFMNP